MMVVYLMELSGQAGSMTGQAERMSWKCWGGFPEEGPLGRELRVRWSYPGGGGGGRGETSRERVRSGGERKRQGCTELWWVWGPHACMLERSVFCPVKIYRVLISLLRVMALFVCVSVNLKSCNLASSH